MIQGGYILVSRKIEDSNIMSKPPLYLKVWVWLLLRAKFADSEGLKRGQVRTSMPEIREAMAYKTGYRRTIPSIKEIRDVLDWLRSPCEGPTKGTMTVTTKVTHGQIITICNYDYYQNSKNYEGHNDGHNEGSTKVIEGAQLEGKKDKERKKDKKEKKKPIEDFAPPEWINPEVWEAFLQMRIAKKAPPTNYALNLIIKDLEKFKASGHNPDDVIRLSIKNNWTAVYEPKPQRNNGQQSQAPKSNPAMEDKYAGRTRTIDFTES